MRPIFIQLVLFSFLFSHTLAGTRHPDVVDEKYLAYGSKFPHVVRIVTIDNKTDQRQLASAVIIQPHWALTAAHVVRDAKGVVLLIGEGEPAISITTVIPHEEFGAETKPGVHDIALCYSTRDFALPGYPQLYSEFDERGKECSIAGYGIYGTFNTGYTHSDSKRRAGQNRVERYEQAVLVCTPSRTNRTPLEFLICPGDSGGGLFIDNKLAGINSFVMCDVGKIPNGSYDSEAGHTRISLYYDWIHKQINAHLKTLAAAEQ